MFQNVIVHIPPKSGVLRTITRFAMHRNGKKRLSRRKTQDFRAKRARKHLAEYNRVNSNVLDIR